MEFLASGVLGSLFGGLFRLAPEVLKWFDRKDERKHELEMFKITADLEKLKGEQRLEEKYVDYSVHEIDAIKDALNGQQKMATSSYKWVSAISALVRPMVTYVIFGLYVLVKCTMMYVAISTGIPWETVVVNSWGVEDWGLLNMILTFWFVGRSIESRK